MLYEFQVGTVNAGNELIGGVKSRLQWINQKGFVLNWDIELQPDLGLELITFILEGSNQDSVFREEDICEVFRHQLSEALAEHIMQYCEEQVLKKEITRSIKKYLNLEKDAVYVKARDILNNCRSSESLNLLLRFGRKNRISQRVLEHLKQNRRILVEGFVTFCLQDYLTEIKYAAELALEELKNEKEYSEFVSLLRYFVDSQNPKINEVNLMVTGDGRFYLWDDSGTKIDEQYIDYYLDEMLSNEVSLDDVLVSILITMSPRHLVLHNTGEQGISEPVVMIRNVFKERISECAGCPKCRPGLCEQHK